MQKRLLAVLLASMFVGNAWAEDKTINISAQDMPSALHSLASQTGIQLLFTADDLKNIRAKAISGAMSAEAALKRLLEGTNYTFRASGNGTYVLQRVGTTLMLNEVTVTATRTERSVDEVPASVSVLTAKKLKTKNRQDVYNALRDEVGLDFVYPTSQGHQVDPIIRGVGGSAVGSTTVTVVDGMPHDTASSALLGHGGLNFTSMQDVERVEVMRGPASVLYGSGAIGGVINVIPKRWKGDAGAEVNASYGSHNTQTLEAAVGTAKENYDVRLSVHDAKSDGYVAVPVSDSFGGLDAGSRKWIDNKVRLMAGFRPKEQHEITFDFQQYGTKSDLYGGRPNEYSKMDGNSATLGYRFDLSDATNIKVKFRQTHLRQAYFYDKGDWNGLAVAGQVTAADLPLAFYGGRTSNTTKLLVQLDTQPFTGNQVIVGYGHDTGDYQTDSTTVAAATTLRGSRDKADAVFIQDEQVLGAVTLLGGVRYDRLDFSPNTVNGLPQNGSGSVDNVVTPRLGARFHLNDSTSFYASYGTAYLPALNSFKFVQPSNNLVDNPNLRPENSTTYEIGMNNDVGFGKLRTSLFHTNYKDKITAVLNPITAKRQYQNIAVLKVDGIEIAYQGDLGNGWQPYTNFSYTKAQDQAVAGGPFNQSLRIAPRKFNLGVTYEPNSSWSATLNGRAVSGMYFNNLTAAQHTNGYFIADAKVNMALPLGDGQKWEAFFAVNNIGGKKYQPFNMGEWSDGRTATIGLGGKF